MIYKFHSTQTENSSFRESIEFSKEADYLRITIQNNCNEHPNYETVLLRKENLFELIGGLLRIQSEMKKDGGNK